MQSSSKVARCLNGTPLMSWRIVDPPNVRVERSHADHYSKALLLWQKELKCREEKCWPEVTQPIASGAKVSHSSCLAQQSLPSVSPSFPERKGGLKRVGQGAVGVECGQIRLYKIFFP